VSDLEATKDEDAEEPPLVGRLLSGKWRVDRLLGTGGVSAVYEATHRNGRRAAIKVLSPEVAGNRRMRGRFQREGYLANRVGHPGAVEVLDDDVSGDVVYLVMELLDGMTLDALRRAGGGHLPPHEAAWVGLELLDVLQAAHTRGILHRDVKPGNVFLTRRGTLKLLDFGIASLREGNDTPGITETGVVLGTPGFMAPEQARGRTDELGPVTDVYAVGATLFRLLTGRLVHEGGTASELQIAVATTDAPSVASVAPSVPRELGRVVDRALSRARADRFPSAAAMKQALAEAATRLERPAAPPVLDEAPAATRKPIEGTPAASAVTASSRGRRPGFMAGLAIALVVVGLAYARYRGASPAEVAPSAAVTPVEPPATAAAPPAPAAAPRPAPSPAASDSVRAGAAGAPNAVSSAASNARGSGTSASTTPRARATSSVSTTKPGPTPSGRPPHELLRQRL
jgi:eukaryotic-like serine/threonine-protein kinase